MSSLTNKDNPIIVQGSAFGGGGSGSGRHSEGGRSSEGERSSEGGRRSSGRKEGKDKWGEEQDDEGEGEGEDEEGLPVRYSLTRKSSAQSFNAGGPGSPTSPRTHVTTPFRFGLVAGLSELTLEKKVRVCVRGGEGRRLFLFRS